MQPRLHSGVMQSVCRAECSQCIMSQIRVLYFVENKEAKDKERDRKGRLFEIYLECQDTSIQLLSMQLFPESDS